MKGELAFSPSLNSFEFFDEMKEITIKEKEN